MAKLVELITHAEEEYLRAREINDSIIEAKSAKHLDTPTQDVGPQYLAIAVKGCSDLMKYVYPQRRAVDLTSEGKNLQNSFADLMRTLLTKKDESENSEQS